jgi:hypothetical protein
MEHCLKRINLFLLNSVGIPTSLQAGRTKNRGLILVGGKIFHFSSSPAVGHTQPLVAVVTGGFFLGVKRPGREADLSSPPTEMLIMRGAIPPLPHKSS